jgi:hypothetical protein
LLKFTDNSHGIYLVSGPAPAAPVIVAEPLDFNALDNSTVRFYFSVAGNEPLAVQWYKDGIVQPGQTNATLVVSNANATALGGYYAIASNSSGSVTSRVAQLTRTVPAVPTLISGPLLSGSPSFTSDVVWTVTAAGENLTYLWRREGVVIPGASTSTLALTNLGATHTGRYSVAVSNANGGFEALSGNLNVAPIILQQPVSTSGVVGGTASFSVVAAGIPPLTYTWRRGASNPTTLIPGATNATLTLTNLALTNAMRYRVTVVSGGSSVASSIVTLTVSETSLPGSPRLSAPVVANGNFQFRLPTQNGYSYLVQTTTNLSNPQWALEQTVSGDGSTKTVTIDATASQKLVRVEVK